MLDRHGRLVVGLTTLATLGFGGAAQAATKTVLAGLPPANQKTFQEKYGSDVNAYFPKTVAIHVGDAVDFVPVGFHNVDLPKKGGKATDLLAPAGKVAGEKDAAGAEFWFNGQNALGFNPPLVTSPQWGKSLSYSGAQGINSGLPLQPKPKAMRVKFTKKGSFKYFCDVHPGMAGQVKVLPKSSRVPSKKSDARTVKRQLAAAEKAAKKFASTNIPANTVQMGLTSKTGAEFFGFLPATQTVAKGTTVQFRFPTNSFEIHTATFGPGNPDSEPNSYLGTLAKSFESPAFAGAAVYPSEAPGTVAQLTKSLHGNGFWNSGVMDGFAASPPPGTQSVTFAEAGTFEFYCLIHPFMKGQVVAQ